MTDLEMAKREEAVHRLRAHSLARVMRRRRVARASMLSVAVLASVIGYGRLDDYSAREQRFAKARAEFDAREAARSASSTAEFERMNQVLAQAQRKAEIAQLRWEQEHPQAVRPVGDHATHPRRLTMGDDDPLDGL